MKTKSYKQNHQSSHKRKFVALVVLMLLILISAASFVYIKSNRKITSTATVPGPTAEEKLETDLHKQDLADQPNTVQKPNTGSTPTTPPSDTSGNKKTISVTITYAGKSGTDSYVVNSYASGVVETGGTCMLTLTKSGSTTITKTSNGVDNVSTTICAPLTIQSYELSSGEWTAVVAYTSLASQGSASTTLTVIN